MSVSRPRLQKVRPAVPGQRKIASFFSSTGSGQENKNLTGFTTPEKVMLNRSNSFLSKAMNPDTGFDEPSSSDTSYDSIEVNNFRNPSLVKSMSVQSTTIKEKSEGVEVTGYRKLVRENISLKRSNSDILDSISGKARKVPRVTTPVPTAQTIQIYGDDLSEEQNEVMHAVLEQKKNVFYTGSAGTGKSVVLRHLIKHLRTRYGNKVGLTASTGMAACNIGGQTVHKFLGIGIATAHESALAAKIIKNGALKHKWTTLKVLVIDEISMIDGVLFDKINRIAKVVRQNNKPFGGIQVVFTGDFFQLPPVSKDFKAKYCFEMSAWGEVINKTILLTTVFRQKGDNELIDMLNALRFGRLDNETTQKFYALSRKVEYLDGIEPTELYPTRFEVKTANTNRLNLIQAEPFRFKAQDEFTKDYQKRYLDILMCEEELVLKDGAQVMYIVNLDDDIVNGSIGTILCFLTLGLWAKVQELYGDQNFSEPSITNELRLLSKRVGTGEAWNDNDAKLFDSIPQGRKTVFMKLCGYASRETREKMLPIVNFKINDTDRCILVEDHQFSLDQAGNLTNTESSTNISRKQLPLLLSWALSIHKAQGQTIDRLRIDLGKSFEKGQVYVALSRATSKDRLELKNFHPNKVQVSDVVREFYYRIGA